MDLLYVIGPNKDKNDSLRYSLRSIEKYCTGYDRIFIVGYKPDFINDNVIFIPCENKYDGYKHRNILDCIITAVNFSDISDNFVLQSDDHFYCKPYDFNKIPLYKKNMLIAKVEPFSRCPKYHASLVNTRQILLKHGYEPVNASSHCGTWFNKTMFKTIEDTLVKDAQESYWGAEPTCLMAAAIHKQTGLPFMLRKDCKARDCSTDAVLKAKIGDAFCFSVYVKAFNKKLMDRWYPEKSKYEK